MSRSPYYIHILNAELEGLKTRNHKSNIQMCLHLIVLFIKYYFKFYLEDCGFEFNYYILVFRN